ncbi:acyltransferase family protein [Frigoribacterium sp. CFBP 13712]|uniref:acyltransferase family protein n=1 Tax=Frigoribacterium sp. CFBP 13712 TaxID=2775309 RepID=UPI001782AB59|nr:acyltransferase family protein [Frigoribacterium sp. CFBP 13712]MBD8703982.1 acyltransferase family protein [Frigoribacterium sp. CFBP 13712]
MKRDAASGSTTNPLAAVARQGPRRDIQGLRALAVLAVVADHLFGWPTGGFIGVDVFFVLSGFLITGLLLREYENTGGISFKKFYQRRIRRILPASLLVLVVTAAAATFFFTTARATSTIRDALFAVVFSANWNFAAAGTDYLQGEGPSSPLQHFWSLAVGEQFYFVWPVIMALVFVTVDRRRSGGRQQARRAIGIAISCIIVLSLVWAFYETAASSTWAYFSTFSRAWELGVGALLAVVTPILSDMRAHVRTVLSWVGLILIFGSLFAIQTSSPFPAPWALLPVLGSALVISGGVGVEPRHVGILTNRVSSYIGDISFSLYLWHFPVIIFADLYLDGLTLFIFAICVMFLLAITAYHLYEKPIHKSRPRKVAGSQAVRNRDARRVDYSKFVYPFTALLAVGTLAVVAIAVTPRDAPVSAFLGTFDADAAEGPKIADNTPAGIQSAAVLAGLSLSDLPDGITPSLDALDYSAWAPEVYQDKCLTVSQENLSACSYGEMDADKSAVVLGDSMAASWMPAIRASLEPDGYRIQMLTMSGCPAFVVSLSNENRAACNSHRDWALSEVDAMRPDLIIVSNLDTVGYMDEPAGLSGYDAWGSSAQDLLKQLPTETKAIVLGVPPRGPKLNDCVVPGSTPSFCTESPSRHWGAVAKAEERAVSEFEGPNVRYINTRDWVCFENQCPPVISNHPVRVDGIHMVGLFTATLAPLLSAEMAEIRS